MLTSHILDGRHACKIEVRRKLLRKTSKQVLKISTYQLSRSVKVMVTDEHPVFGHRLEGLLINVDGELYGILLYASHHLYSKIIGIEVADVRNRRLCLVEGALMVNDFHSTLWIRGHHAHRGGILSYGGTYMLNSSRSYIIFLLASVSTGLGRSIGAAVTYDRAFCPISSTFGGPPIEIPSSIDESASLGTPSKAG